jgi:hypothetical protein
MAFSLSPENLRKKTFPLMGFHTKTHNNVAKAHLLKENF